MDAVASGTNIGIFAAVNCILLLLEVSEGTFSIRSGKYRTIHCNESAKWSACSDYLQHLLKLLKLRITNEVLFLNG